MVDKTNAMRKLDSLKINYREYTYSPDITNGLEVATAVGENPKQVFKTLVTVAKSGAHYVYMIPVGEELDLKKAAAAVGEKAVDMLKSKDLLGLTGYIHGGCSPIGMKKFFRTTINRTAADFPTIFFSGGRRGLQIELSLADLAKVIKYELADITVTPKNDLNPKSC